jgi:anthranilate synthase component 1
MTIKTTDDTFRLDAVPDPISVLQKLAPSGDAVLFESPEGEGRRAEKSLLFPRNALRIEARGANVTVDALTEGGKRALELIEPAMGAIAKTTCEGARLTLTFDEPSHEGSDSDRIKAPNTTDVLRAICKAYNDLTDGKALLRLPGVFAYDLMERFEALPGAQSDDIGFPDYVFFVPEIEVELRNDDHSVRIVHHGFGPSKETRASEEIGKIREAMIEDAGIHPISEPDAKSQSPRYEVDTSDGDFASLVSRLKDHIRAGDVFQIVPSRTFSMPCDDPVGAYRKLREQNPSPYMFFVRTGEFTLFGASPEACVKVSGNPRTVEIHPIAGTKPRGRLASGEIDRDLDDRLEAELRLNEKELAEHMMLVDMARNDVARISRAGTRRVKSLCALEKYSRVMHLVSMVEGELKEGFDALHAYIASMNMGTVVGAPKIEAARLLRKYEKTRRGPYAGAVAYLTSEGEMDSAIVIRTALVKDGLAAVRAGAGIVYDSDPHAEAEETRNKADAVLRAIRSSQGGKR